MLLIPMKTRRIVLALPIVVSVVALASQGARADADAGAPDAGVADAGPGDAGDGGDGDGGDSTPFECGAMAPPHGAGVVGAGCC
jgi:hypothetical protein